MSEHHSYARWCGSATIVTDYSDVGALVALARKVRREPVDFDWWFSGEDLLRLRRAVYEWGCRDQGAYKAFDARVLRAINEALGEPDSLWTLTPRPQFASMSGSVECHIADEGFRLSGRATFDLVYGYGETGVRDAEGALSFLGPTVRRTLAESVAMLGWDLTRLQATDMRPVRNVIYGFAPDHGADLDMLPRGPELAVEVAFQGPFAISDDTDVPCLFTNPVSNKSGVYLWTISVGGVDRVWYVGQTRRGFGQRTGEHVGNMLSGFYTPYNAAAMAEGRNALAAGATKQNWPASLPAHLRNWRNLVPEVLAVIGLVRLHVAQLPSETRLLDRVEGAIGQYFKSHPCLALAEFVTPGLKVPAMIPGDQLMRISLSSQVPIAGLPLELLVPPARLPADVREFVASAPWTFARTYAETWPHEYVVRSTENAEVLQRLAEHVFTYGVKGRFYDSVFRYFHEGGKVYWSMDPTPESTTLINRCDADQTYEVRLAAGTLPPPRGTGDS